MTYRGIDHVDLRVPALAAVEAFYDVLLPRLGLPKKSYSTVTFGGESWQPATEDDCNTIEWHEDAVDGRPAAFFGVIEEVGAQPAHGRIAFAVSEDALDALEPVLRAAGAREIERTHDDPYPALFFTDPIGTRLELCARRAR